MKETRLYSSLTMTTMLLSPTLWPKVMILTSTSAHPRLSAFPNHLIVFLLQTIGLPHLKACWEISFRRWKQKVAWRNKKFQHTKKMQFSFNNLERLCPECKCLNVLTVTEKILNAYCCCGLASISFSKIVHSIFQYLGYQTKKLGCLAGRKVQRKNERLSIPVPVPESFFRQPVYSKVVN